MLLALSYADVLGGAERVLLDVVPALEDECWLACPPGALADAATARGVRVIELRERDLQLRGGLRRRASAVIELLDYAREARALAGSLHPDLVIAWSMRPLLACRWAPSPDAHRSCSRTTTSSPGP